MRECRAVGWGWIDCNAWLYRVWRVQHSETSCPIKRESTHAPPQRLSCTSARARLKRDSSSSPSGPPLIARHIDVLHKEYTQRLDIMTLATQVVFTLISD